MKIRYLAAVAVLTSAGALVPAAAASAASTACPKVNNTVWNGYAACGTKFTDIEAFWYVPASHGGGNRKASFWAGLGGLGSATTLEQTGTESNVTKGKAVYTAWWEFVPSPAVFLSRKKYPVHAGDLIGASVVVTKGDHYHFGLVDYGPKNSAQTRWSWTLEVTNPGATHASAEVIAEDTGDSALTNFGTIHFTSVYANGTYMRNPHKFVMPGGKVKVSKITEDVNFDVTFLHK